MVCFLEIDRIPASLSTRTGFTKPNSAMLAAICSTCASERVRGLRAYGISFSIGQISIRHAIASENIARTSLLIDYLTTDYLANGVGRLQPR